MSYQTDLEFARGKANAWKHLQEKAANGWRPAYAEELEQYACRKRMEAEDEMRKSLQRCRQRKIPQNQKVAEKLH